jgi:hypothetical protein
LNPYGKWEICSEDFASISGTGEEELRSSGKKINKKE